MENTTRLTIYSTWGYSGCLTIRAALGTNGITSKLTQGGLTVYLEREARDIFDSVMADYPDACYRVGDSLDRHVQPDTGKSGH